MITNVYITIITIIKSAKVAYHWKTGKKPTFMLTTCPKQKFDAPNEWVLNIANNKALTQL
jgi:hypothetical protein